MALAGSGGYVGNEACIECHEDAGESFAGTAHGRSWRSADSYAASCEDCHGPGEAHADSSEPEDIMNLETAPAHEASATCLECHGGDVARNWQTSEHASFDVRCTDCHSAHAPWTKHPAQANRHINKSCLGCHSNMQKHLYQRSSHPLENGLMSCASCHNPHGSAAEGAIAALTPNDKCYECHADKRGPYLFEHAPVREDCKTCHDPHGSNQTMLLHTSPPRLCQSCHLFGHHQTVPGQATQVWNQNRSCTNCHPRIHGSNHPSGVIFMR